MHCCLPGASPANKVENAMVRFINNTREQSHNDKTFQVGQTVFVVASPASARPQNRAQYSMTSLTIPMPIDEDGQHEAEASDQEHDELPWTDSGPACPDDAVGGNDPAPKTGMELVPSPAKETTGSMERRLANIFPDQPVLSDAGLAPAQPEQVWSDKPRERPSPFRYVALAVILLLLVGSIALTIYFQRQTQRVLQAMRASLRDQQQTASNLVIEEVRREIRGIPIADPQPALDRAEANARAIRELQQTITERMQKADGQTQQLSQVIRDELAEQKRASAAADDLKEPILAEIRELKDAVADLRSRPAYVPPVVVPSAPAAAAAITASAAQDADVAAPAPAAPPPVAAAQDPAATLAQAQQIVDSQPAERPAAVYLVDATGHLKDLVPEALAEVRRLIQYEDSANPAYVLMLYSDRLVRIAGLAQSAEPSAERRDAPVVDLGPADLATAVKIALKSRPRTLHLMSDTLAGGAKLPELLKGINAEGTRIDATQFHYRDGQEAMKQIARDHNGFYTFIAGSR